MRAAQVVSLVLFAFTTTASLIAQPNETATAANATIAYVYVGENRTPTGQIAGFAVQRNGSVVSISGSPVSGPSQNIVASVGFVFGTDGTNIATYTRAANGSLRASSEINGTAHNDTPGDSAVGAMTLDRSGSSLYAAEVNFQGADNDAYAEFGIQRNGALAFHNNTGISVDDNSPLQFSENNKLAYGQGCYFANWDVFGFHREANGQLVPFDPGNIIPPNPTNDLLCPSAEAASAKGFLAIAYDIASVGSKQNIAIYRITPGGALELISSSIVATGFTGIGGLRFDPTGTFLAAAGQNGIEVFKLSPTGTLTRLGPVLDDKINFVDVKWDNAGHVFAISNAALYVFTLNGAGLRPTGAPRPLTNAASLAVLPIR